MTHHDADSRPSLVAPIQLVGEKSATLDGETLDELPVEERTIEVVCSTGDRYTDRWKGVPFFELLETEAATTASFPPETTHFLVESEDGQRGCIAIEDTFDALLAFGRNGQPLPEAAGYTSRFVAPDVLGPRTVKNVASIEGKKLDPGEDPESYERLLEMEGTDDESEDTAEVEPT
ncbi:molybdopterin-dependent oxidoreductase [Natronobacterium gregoryi]|uniref:Molybdopterin-binding oxidoreductase n=2 Tax=Natronobacterium gregoryi TaxID=44930 RepID=L0ADC2_NATGS|nr:molybdopterin-dependent oxidoreductase [Natronobacterium gregoryi]AFZ71851.1 sulfite oxidase-like oxidoreductase [Natronobacterium gregoryi SP2]ELY73079.1 oxidoreductase molybdopterin binding protein [Natronobacterium gregoryi SP2]PLK19368.1 molybdopterin-binding oxidoreductase [Natronobacterium gregoryi SP2]SFJ50273.1 Oxidoreductase molybdopterin binding domain-containing protein [Natronobacterium gregoryi]